MKRQTREEGFKFKQLGGSESARYVPNRTSRQFMVKTMDQAVERFKEQLRRAEHEKRMQQEDFKWRIQAEQELIESERKQKAEHQALHYLQLV